MQEGTDLALTAIFARYSLTAILTIFTEGGKPSLMSHLETCGDGPLISKSF